MRSVVAWASALVVALGAAAFFFALATNNFTLIKNGYHPDRIVEIHGITVLGYRGTQRTWNIKAAYAWSGYDKSTGHFENLYDGVLYEDNRIVMDRLKAKQGKGDSSRDWLETEGGVEADIYLYKENKVRHLKIHSDKLFYNSNVHKTIVQDHVLLQYDNTLIQTDYAEINHDNNTVYVTQGFNMTDADKKIRANWMEANLDNETAIIKDEVSMVIHPRRSQENRATTLDCEFMVFNLNEAKGQRVQFERKVKFIQNDHEVFANGGTYNDGSGELNLNNRVELVLVDTGTLIRCDELNAQIDTPDQRLQDASFHGNIDIQEHDKTVKALAGHFDSKADGIQLDGNVRMTVHQFRNLLRKESADRIQNHEVETMLSKPALLEADAMYLDRRSQNAYATGDVHVVQKEQQARADIARYIEDDDIIYLDENVTLLKENGEWIQADRVLAHLQEESFEALGKVETEFILKDRQR